MRILFDQCTPAPLRSGLAGHVVVTTDQRLKHQQNLSRRKIAILVLTTTSWPRIRRKLNIVVDAIDSLKSGDYRELPFPA